MIETRNVGRRSACFALACLLGAVGLLAGCGGQAAKPSPTKTASTAATSAQPAAKTYQINYGTILWPGALPFFVALGTGILKQHGIHVNKIIVGSGGTRRAALLAGQIQFGDFAFSNEAVAAAHNAPLKFVASTYDYETVSLLVREALKSQVKSIADLKGKRIGFDTPGALPWSWEQIFLRGAHLDPQRDVKMVSGIKGPNVILNALKAGKIDAYAYVEPIVSAAVAQRIAYPLVNMENPATQQKWVGAESLGSGLMTTDKLISQEPDLVKRMVAANADALKYIRQHTPTQLADLLQQSARTKQYWSGMKRSWLLTMLRGTEASFKVTDGRISRSGVQNEVKVSIEGGVIKHSIPFSKLVDSQFAGTKA